MKLAYKFLAGLSVIIVFTIVSFLVLSSRNTAIAPETGDNVQTAEQQFETEVPNFPTYKGVGITESSFTRTDDGFILESRMSESTENIIFWYYEELIDQGWQITKEPDVGNSKDQRFIAVSPDGRQAQVYASNNGEITNLVISIDR